jgi:hypothetical protein
MNSTAQYFFFINLFNGLILLQNAGDGQFLSIVVSDGNFLLLCG